MVSSCIFSVDEKVVDAIFLQTTFSLSLNPVQKYAIIANDMECNYYNRLVLV
jgi:hypothetical protein